MARPRKQTLSKYNVGLINRLWWYISPLKVDVGEELNERPDLIEKLGRYKKIFINWCAIERITFEPDLDEEVKEFKAKFIDSRLCNVDYRLWLETRERLFKRDNYTCHYCGKRGGILEIDHKLPLSKGGNNEDDNLVTACRNCNRRKHDKTEEEFILLCQE